MVLAGASLGLVAFCLLVHQNGLEGAQVGRVPTISTVSPITSSTTTTTITTPQSKTNKTTSQQQESGGNKTIDDSWNFELVEYDLIEFLQDLSARYQSAVNSSLTGDEPPQPQTPAPAKAHVGQRQQQQQPRASTQADDKLDPKIADLFESNKTAVAGAVEADQEVGESSWQYGMFDRFTRPKSTSTTPEPRYTLGPGVELDVRQFNMDECGLRTYQDEQPYGNQAYPADQIDLSSSSSEASRELLHRRQRPQQLDYENESVSGGQYESIADYLRRRPSQSKQPAGLASQQQLDREQPAASASEIADWPVKNERDAYDSYKSKLDKPQQAELKQQQQQQQQQQSQSQQSLASNSPAGPDGDEFNLLSRRNWLQHQLGTTLQMFGLNSTSGQLANTLVAYSSANTTGFGAGNLRENMMKLSGKSGKSLAAVNPLEALLGGRQDELKLEPRVIGGSDARLGDSPWSVSLQALVSRPGTGQVEYRHYCGGTIISEHYVLTAAHCLDFMVGRESRLFVVVGDLNWRMNPASLFGRRYGIDKLIIHGGYKNTAFGHDIGLIRTKEPIRPLKRNGKYIINSVCLPEKGVEHSGEAELVGWGLFSNRNEMADSLQIADVPILPRPLCVDLYRRRTGLIQWLIGIELITEKQICAGTFGRGICQGDSGSALVFNDRSGTIVGPGSELPPIDADRDRPVANESGDAASAAAIASGPGLAANGPAAGVAPSIGRNKSTATRQNQHSSRATIIGIVAFGGIRRCSYQSLPGVYMQTSKYLDWILPRIQTY